MAQRQVHLLVVEGAVHVEQVIGEPAESEEEDQHQYNFGQPLPGLHLWESGGVPLALANAIISINISIVLAV